MRHRKGLSKYKPHAGDRNAQVPPTQTDHSGKQGDRGVGPR